MRGVLGIAVILLLAWALSENRTRVPWRVVTVGVLLQLVLALLFLRFPPARAAFLVLNRAVEALQNATEAGTGFVFGYLGGGQLPFAETQPGTSFIFAFRALPMVLVVSALATLLFYWGVLQRIVQAFAWVLRWAVGIGGPLGLGAAVHIFVGHIEAPLLIRPYLMRLARGELFALMSCGMAGIAGTVMVLYAALVGSVIPNALGNILIAAVISTPAALAIAALMIPFRPDPSPTAQLVIQDPPVSSMDAVAKGVIHTGGIGTGSIAKVMHNSASFTLDLVMAECWTAGVKGRHRCRDDCQGFQRSRPWTDDEPQGAPAGDLFASRLRATLSLALARKDLGLAQALAHATDTPTPLGALCEKEMIEAMSRGWADRDASIFLTLQEKRASI